MFKGIGMIMTSKKSGTVFSTWNPSDKSANVTLDATNLIATRAGQGSARNTAGKASGKWYWEIKLTSTGFNYDIWLGIANASESLATSPGDPGLNGWAIALDGGDYHHGGFINSVIGGYTGATNDVVGFALDMDNGTLKILKNNTYLIPAAGVSGDPIFTGIVGTIYAILFYQSQSVVTTANFGATTMAYTAPAGYNQGLYT